MNLGDIRGEARILLDDTVPDGNGNYLWSDAELNLYINKAVDEAAERAFLIVDSTTPECCRIAVTAGNATYPVHDSVLRIERVYDSTNQQVLSDTDFRTLDDSGQLWDTVTNKPTHYIFGINHYGLDDDNNHTITLYPVPNAGLTLNLTVFRTTIDNLITDFDIPEIPGRRHFDLIDWVLSLAYMKRDVDTFDPNKSAQHADKFAQNFGIKKSARWNELHRSQRRIRTRAAYK